MRAGANGKMKSKEENELHQGCQMWGPSVWVNLLFAVQFLVGEVSCGGMWGGSVIRATLRLLCSQCLSLCPDSLEQLPS